MKDVRQVVKARLDERQAQPVQAEVIGDDLEGHGRGKADKISQGVLVPRLPGQPRKIPDVLPFDLDLAAPVVILEQLR